MTQVFEPPILREYRDQIIKMGELLAERKTLAGTIIAYQLGFADRDGRARDPEPGALVRPSLCLWATQACGGDVREALPLAVAIELLHTFLLIHRDIQEGLRSRDGRETAWEIWGLGQAVNAGDALHGLAISLLSRSALPESQAVRIFTGVMRGVNRQIAFHRSGALMGACFEAAADVAGAGDGQRRLFYRAGRHLGVGSVARSRELLTKASIGPESLDCFDEMAEYFARKTR